MKRDSEDYSPISLPDKNGNFPPNALERLKRLLEERGVKPDAGGAKQIT